MGKVTPLISLLRQHWVLNSAILFITTLLVVQVAKGAMAASRRDATVRLVLVNGCVGVVAFDPSGQPFAVISFTVTRGKIVEMDVLGDPMHLCQLNLSSSKTDEPASCGSVQLQALVKSQGGSDFCQYQALNVWQLSKALN
jgi:hypothetical protein